MTDIRHRSEELRRGATSHREVSEACDGVSSRLTGVVVEAGDFGDIPSAARLAASAVAARETQAHDAAAEALRRTDLADRATTAASLADLMTSLTTDAARSGAPGPALPGVIGDVTPSGPGG